MANRVPRREKTSSYAPVVPRRARKISRNNRATLPIAFSTGIERLRKTSENVARDIVHDIVTLGLQTGANLPSEAEMLQHYGVSRESLREGLRILEVQGLITIRRGPGGGPIVGSVDAVNLGRLSTLYYHLVGATYSEVVDAWARADGWIAELVSRHPDREVVKRALAPYIARAVPPDDENLEDYVDSHTRFHYVMGQLCGNKVLELTLSSFGRIVGHHVVLHVDPRDERDIIESEHRAIAQAVVNGRAKKARELSEIHAHSVADFYRGKIGPQMDDFVEWR